MGSLANKHNLICFQRCECLLKWKDPLCCRSKIRLHILYSKLTKHNCLMVSAISLIWKLFKNLFYVAFLVKFKFRLNTLDFIVLFSDGCLSYFFISKYNKIKIKRSEKVTGKLDPHSIMCKLLYSWHSFPSLNPWGFSSPSMNRIYYRERSELLCSLSNPMEKFYL